MVVTATPLGVRTSLGATHLLILWWRGTTKFNTPTVAGSIHSTWILVITHRWYGKSRRDWDVDGSKVEASMDAIWFASMGQQATCKAVIPLTSMDQGIPKKVAREVPRHHHHHHRRQIRPSTQWMVASVSSNGRRRALVALAMTIAAIPTVTQAAIGALSWTVHVQGKAGVIAVARLHQHL